MIKHTKSDDHLNNEILYLREQNEALSAELAFHRQIFRQMYEALDAANELTSAINKQGAVRQLAKENEHLKCQLKLARLSEREKEILKLIVRGYTSKEMASKLNISKLTIDTHRKNIQQKLGVTKVVELLKIAIRSDFS